MIHTRRIRVFWRFWVPTHDNPPTSELSSARTSVLPQPFGVDVELSPMDFRQMTYKIKLDKNIILEAIDRKYGGSIPNLLSQWEISNKSIGLNTQPDRSTIYHWINGNIPRTTERFLKFCGVLDIDPFALILNNEDDIEKIHATILKSFWSDYWTQPALSFVKDFIGQKTIWPPSFLAEKYYQRSWFELNFRHDYFNKSNHYISICIDPNNLFIENHPQVFHIAYQNSGGSKLGPWIQYGLFIRFGRKTKLWSISGQFESHAHINKEEIICIGTWIGQGNANFKVTSLHPFTGQIRDSTHKVPDIKFSA
ncbi:hypothetical protein [Glycocaulis albus]|uniref:hypothetical protein n=1 Tax=Glycocaulis albus TaxID=1382801 RepID=UPI00166D3A54|nr:hypothetical protein [Glycocaulis albus]